MSTIAENAKAIFLEAVEKHEPTEWSDFLNEACGDDRELRQRVEGLLQAHQEKDSLFDRPNPTANYQPVEHTGQLIGPYKLRERVGAGGMGEVWAAEQKKPLRRKVALKVIKPGMDSQAVIARFEAEREALALMDHPNIARVLDAGTTEQGRPYFVMELIRGMPITEYCDQGKLTVRKRLELFIQVCNAVQHAHQKGIIHRDIKPSNVLVTEHDGTPVPKVIDFGVAKALHQPLTEQSIYTGLYQAIGTLAYMSPEQAALSGRDVDTRADVYGLGVLLYELLIGVTPFDRKQLENAALDEACRLIREQDPPKPSTKISTLGPQAAAISTGRGTDTATLGKTIRGDLDWISIKALEKDRSRRYETANEFAADIQRYLHDETVSACPPSATYRFAKFARRNKAALSTLAVVTLALLLGLAGTSRQAVRATTAENLASDRLLAEQQARELAEEERDRANRLLLSLQESLFDQAMSYILSGNLVAAEKRIAGLRDIGAKDSARKLDAFRLIQLGDYEGAIAIIAPEVERQRGSIAYRSLLTIVYGRTGDYPSKDRSRVILNQLDEPTTIEDILFATLGGKSADPTDYQLTLKRLERSFELRPSPVLLLALGTWRGLVALETGDVEMADRSVHQVNAAKELLGLKSREVRFQCLKTALLVAATHRACGQGWNEYLTDVEDVVKVIERSRPTTIYRERFYLAHYYYERGSYEKALSWLKQDAIEGNDSATNSYLALAAESGVEVDADFLAHVEQRGELGRMGLAFYQLIQDDEEDALRASGNPQSPYGFLTRLATLTATGQHTQARDLAAEGTNRYRASDGGYYTAFCTKVCFPSVIQEWDEARTLSAASEFASPRRTESEIYFFLGLKCLANDKTAARTYFQKCLEYQHLFLGSHVWSRAFLKKLESQPST